jgi:hypothetical protein
LPRRDQKERGAIADSQLGESLMDLRRDLRNGPSDSRLKHRLRPMRSLRTDRTAQTVIAGHAFMHNLRRGHYALGLDAPSASRTATGFTEPARAI